MYRDPLPPGVLQKVARLSLVMQYDDGYTVVVQGEDLHATATFPLALGPDVEIQGLRDLALVPSLLDTRKLVLEVTLVNDNLHARPVLRVQGAFPGEGPPIPSA
jgi:hypothetical protein